jgi:hypothetical protein
MFDKIKTTLSGQTIIFDSSDLELVIGKNMYVADTGYVIITVDKKQVLLHRYLLDNPDSMIDHINGNPLDNRRSNLRLCTPQENTRNRKSVKGVNYRPDRGTWRAYISVDRVQIYLGSFAYEIDALEARHIAEIKYFGEFAPERG